MYWWNSNWWNSRIIQSQGESFPIESFHSEYNLVTYEITPETGYNWENFPKVFKDKYTLRGTVLLAEKYYSIYLERVSGSCRLSTSEKEYRMLVLYNSSGELGNWILKIL